MPDQAPRERLRPLLFVLIACTAVSMINPERSEHPALRDRHADIRRAAVAHRGVVLAELPRLGGARLRRDAAQPGDVDRRQPAHPRPRRRARARHDRAVAAVRAAHRAVRGGGDSGVHRPARHGDRRASRWRAVRRLRRAPATQPRSSATATAVSRHRVCDRARRGLGGVCARMADPEDAGAARTHSCTRRSFRSARRSGWRARRSR